MDSFVSDRNTQTLQQPGQIGDIISMLEMKSTKFANGSILPEVNWKPGDYVKEVCLNFKLTFYYLLSLLTLPHKEKVF